MRLRFVILIVVGAILLTIGGICATNPLRRSEEKISTWLEAQTPLGSSPAEVLAYAKKKNWLALRNQGSDGQTHGEFIRGELGEYRTLFVTSVTVFWEFDAASKLQRIRVWKTVDAL